MSWRSIGSAPKDQAVLLWWRPINGNPYAETCIVGEVSSYEPGKVWHSAGSRYYDIWHVSHWMPLPSRPVALSACLPQTKGVG